MANDKMVTVEITMEEFAGLVYNYTNRKELEEQYNQELRNISKNIGVMLNDSLTGWQIKELNEFLRLIEDEEDTYLWEFLEHLGKGQESE